MTLASAHHSSPRVTAKYVLYLTRRDDDETACMAKVFAAPYVARKFLDALLEDDGWVWEDETTIRSETGIVVSTRWFPEAMRACVEHVYTTAERDWRLDESHLTHAKLFRYGPDVRPTSEGGVEEVVRAPRPAPQPRASREGLVPVADVAAQLGVDARDVRQALRKLKVTKPAAGWAWPASEVPSVVSLVRGAL